MDDVYSKWEKLLDERQLMELHFARLYVAEFHHGTDGHNRLLLIDLLAKILDRAYESGLPMASEFRDVINNRIELEQANQQFNDALEGNE